MRCQGWRRYGGVFTFGPVKWEQCTKRAVIMLTVRQEGKTETLPACKECWNETLLTGIKVLASKPITSKKQTQCKKGDV